MAASFLPFITGKSRLRRNSMDTRIASPFVATLTRLRLECEWMLAGNGLGRLSICNVTGWAHDEGAKGCGGKPLRCAGCRRNSDSVFGGAVECYGDWLHALCAENSRPRSLRPQ